MKRNADHLAAKSTELPGAFRFLSGLTRRIPNFPHASALSNRIAKPLYCWRYRGRLRVKVWNDIEMYVDPADTIGGNLAFIPQLFDVWERDAIRRHLPRGGVFVDIGANIGSYSLWAARQTGPRGRILSYEAENTNFAFLVENIKLNDCDHIDAFHVGVSDKAELLKLRLCKGNSGGHSFEHHPSDASSVEADVECQPLSRLVADVDRIDFLKIDIEGFEQRVLSRFFLDIPPRSPLRPKYLLTEILHGPVSDLVSTIRSAGYKLENCSAHNALFARL